MPESLTAAELNDRLHTLCEDTYPEDVLVLGRGELPVRGVLVTWMASTWALQAAVDRGFNVIVSHEDPVLLPSGAEATDEALQVARRWPVNAARMSLVQRHDLAVIRCHRTLDAWCIPDVWCRDILGLGEPVVKQGERGYGYCQVYRVKPTPAGELVEHFKTTLGLSTIRAHLQSPGRPVSRIGNVWGGVGNSRNFFTTGQVLMEGVDMVVGGETDEHAAYFYAESGVDLVELGHSRSEQPGLEKLVPWLRDTVGVPAEMFRHETPLEFM